MSLRTRLLVSSLLLLTLGLTAFGTFCYLAQSKFLHEQQVDQLLLSARALSAPARPADRHEPGPEFFEHAPGLWAKVTATDGTVLYQWPTTSTSSGYGPTSDSLTTALPSDVPAFPSFYTTSVPGSLSDGSSSTFQVVAFTLQVRRTSSPSNPSTSSSTATPESALVVLAAPSSDVDSTLTHLIWLEFYAGLAVLVVAAFVGTILTNIGLRPLSELKSRAKNITSSGVSSSSDLSVRLPSDPHTEVGQLAEALNEMLAAIESGFTDLQESEARYKRFVADASHELRTPLSAVSAWSELFDKAKDNPDDLERLVRNVRSETQRMKVLVDDLLLLSRLDSYESNVELEATSASSLFSFKEVDVVDLVEASLAPFRSLHPEFDLLLSVGESGQISGVSQSSFVVVADQVRLRQVFDNLLENAYRYGAPPLEVQVDSGVFPDSEAPAVRISFRDHGPGIEASKIPFVFERFWTSSSSRSRSQSAPSTGSGLGLSIVSRIVEAHKGQVTVESLPLQSGTDSDSSLDHAEETLSSGIEHVASDRPSAPPEPFSSGALFTVYLPVTQRSTAG